MQQLTIRTVAIIASGAYENGNENHVDKDALKLIKATANKEDLSSFQQEIHSMSAQERLQFAQALNRQARDFNYQAVMDITDPKITKNSPLIDIEAPRDKQTGELVDLDILVFDNAHSETAKMGSARTASRTDLFDPKDGSGKEIDGLQQASKDAGAYKQMEDVLRSDELSYGDSQTRQSAAAGKSSRYDEIYSRMSEQIADPDRRARAQEAFKTGNTTITDKYDMVTRSSFPEYSVMQLPEDMRSTLEKPYDRVVNAQFRETAARYRSAYRSEYRPEYRTEYRTDGGSYYSRGNRSDYNRSSYGNGYGNGYGSGYRNSYGSN